MGLSVELSLALIATKAPVHDIALAPLGSIIA